MTAEGQRGRRVGQTGYWRARQEHSAIEGVRRYVKRLGAILIACMAASPVASAEAGGLGGSRASLLRQHRIAKEHDFTFLRTPAQIREFVENERLEKLEGNADYDIGPVSFPYARSAVKLFVERLAAQFRAATGDKLVVTSLTRPTTHQPRNASPLSVHPAGMAVDFRVPATTSGREWLERVLLSLEGRNVLDVTRERHPPHYHVAVFPDEYVQYVATLPAVATAAATTVAAEAARFLDELPRFQAGTTMPTMATASINAAFLPLGAAAGVALLFLAAAALGLRFSRTRDRTRESRDQEPLA